jgi:hypothetical protein
MMRQVGADFQSLLKIALNTRIDTVNLLKPLPVIVSWRPE